MNFVNFFVAIRIFCMNVLAALLLSHRSSDVCNMNVYVCNWCRIICQCFGELLWSPRVLTHCWHWPQTGAFLWQNQTPVGQLKRSVLALCDANALVSSLNLAHQPFFRYHPGTVYVSVCILAFSYFWKLGAQKMRREKVFVVHISSDLNCSFGLFD